MAIDTALVVPVAATEFKAPSGGETPTTPPLYEGKTDKMDWLNKGTHRVTFNLRMGEQGGPDGMKRLALGTDRDDPTRLVMPPDVRDVHPETGVVDGVQMEVPAPINMENVVELKSTPDGLVDQDGNPVTSGTVLKLGDQRVRVDNYDAATGEVTFFKEATPSPKVIAEINKILEITDTSTPLPPPGLETIKVPYLHLPEDDPMAKHDLSKLGDKPNKPGFVVEEVPEVPAPNTSTNSPDNRPDYKMPPVPKDDWVGSTLTNAFELNRTEKQIKEQELLESNAKKNALKRDLRKLIAIPLAVGALALGPSEAPVPYAPAMPGNNLPRTSVSGGPNTELYRPEIKVEDPGKPILAKTGESVIGLVQNEVAKAELMRQKIRELGENAPKEDLGLLEFTPAQVADAAAAFQENKELSDQVYAELVQSIKDKNPGFVDGDTFTKDGLAYIGDVDDALAKAKEKYQVAGVQ